MAACTMIDTLVPPSRSATTEHNRDDIPQTRVSRQQGRPAQQALRRLRTTDDLAPQLGKKLGRGQVLLRSLSARQGPQ